MLPINDQGWRRFHCQFLSRYVEMTLRYVAIAELVLCWLLWGYPFLFRADRSRRTAVVTARAARWGILLQTIAVFLTWFQTGRSQPLALIVLSMIVAPICVVCAWQAVDHLGKQFRIQAGLYADHDLVRSGPYRFVRHPIYASLMGMMLATGGVFSSWPVLLAAIALFIAGTEIRVRVEDGLLAARFKEEFAKYRAKVPAYLPWVR